MVRKQPRHPRRRWEFPLQDTSHRTAAKLAGSLNLSEIGARLLVRRGHGTPELADAFLSRRLDLMHDPSALPDMDRAVGRIAEAVEKRQRIVLFGDYDADGISATALLTRFLRLLKRAGRSHCEVLPLVPERADGYGLGAAALQKIRRLKPNLLITLDNGTSAQEAIAELAAGGAATIVVDHHSIGAELPAAVAVVNPKRADSTYPFSELCGAGLAFKLAWALAVHFSKSRRVLPEFREFLLDAAAFAALGTLADVMPLVNENRVLAHHGLTALARSAAPGVAALRAACRLEGALSTADVTFRIAPRINAAGRCGTTADALQLLLTEDAAEAAGLAQKLEEYNTERQSIEDRILGEAQEMAALAFQAEPQSRALVLDSSNWHTGVVGIVASRLVDEFHRPAVMLCVDNQTGLARGSGRSIRRLNLYESLAQSQEHLLNFGGHAAAAGLTLKAENLPKFRAAFQTAVSRILTEADLVPALYVDEAVSLEQVTPSLLRDLERFEPCGAGNHRPMLAALGITAPALPRLMGKEERHVSFFARQQSASLRVVGFNFGGQLNTLCELCQQGPFDLAFRPQLNTWRDETRVELILEAFRQSEG